MQELLALFSADTDQQLAIFLVAFHLAEFV